MLLLHRMMKGESDGRRGNQRYLVRLQDRGRGGDFAQGGSAQLNGGLLSQVEGLSHYPCPA